MAIMKFWKKRPKQSPIAFPVNPVIPGCIVVLFESSAAVPDYLLHQPRLDLSDVPLVTTDEVRNGESQLMDAYAFASYSSAPTSVYYVLPTTPEGIVRLAQLSALSAGWDNTGLVDGAGKIWGELPR